MFFYFESVNQEIAAIIKVLFGEKSGEAEPEKDLADDKEPVRHGAIIQELQQYTEDKFKDRYGWIDLAISVAKESGTSYFEIMDKPVLAVLSLAAYLSAKVELIESRMAKK